MILHFNPGHETAVQNTSPYYTAPANVVAMQRELSFLPAWYGKAGDVVLVEDSNNIEYYSFLVNHFPTLPKRIVKNQLVDYPNSEVSLWGISPQAIHFFNEINNELDIDMSIPEWHDEYLYLTSRQNAKDCLTELSNKLTQISATIIPHFHTQLEDIEEMVKASDKQLLAKAPYSSSGRGLLWLPRTGLTRTERQILHGILKKQGQVSLEQVLDKQVDFAMEFLSDGCGNISFAGYSLFYTNNKGAYEGNYIGSQKQIEKVLSDKIPALLLEDVKENLIAVLKEKYNLYKGCIGVDMLIYKEDEEFKIHPCLEINMRYNMGFLALKLYDNYIDINTEGQFKIDFSPKFGEIFQKHLSIQAEHPALIENGKLKKGYFPLCPVNEDSRYWAYVLLE